MKILAKSLPTRMVEKNTIGKEKKIRKKERKKTQDLNREKVPLRKIVQRNKCVISV